MSFDEETFALNRILQPPTRFILNINMFLASFSELNPKIDARSDNPVSSFERTERERELLAGNGYHPISVTNNNPPKRDMFKSSLVFELSIEY